MEYKTLLFNVVATNGSLCFTTNVDGSCKSYTVAEIGTIIVADYTFICIDITNLQMVGAVTLKEKRKIRKYAQLIVPRLNIRHFKYLHHYKSSCHFVNLSKFSYPFYRGYCLELKNRNSDNSEVKLLQQFATVSRINFDGYYNINAFANNVDNDAAIDYETNDDNADVDKRPRIENFIFPCIIFDTFSRIDKITTLTNRYTFENITPADFKGCSIFIADKKLLTKAAIKNE